MPTVMLHKNNSKLKELFKKHSTTQNFQIVLSDTENVIGDALKVQPNLIILEQGSSETDIFFLCYRIKNHPSIKDVIVLIVSHSEDENFELEALNAGANEYIYSPLLRPKALMARIQSLLKKNGNIHNTILQTEDEHTLRIDQDLLSIYLNDKHVRVTKTEFDLITLLSSKPGKLFTRKEIYATLWNKNDPTERTLDVHIRHLRKKIGNGFILTQRGVGYRLLNS
jgi:two-component system alkaline phosphatase synthesis response regulator PhoP